MCYSDSARPPLPPVVGGGAADHGDLTLTSSDGTKFMAYYARAAKPTGAGMVVLPDVRGLHQFFKELAQRFAEAGIDSVDRKSTRLNSSHPSISYAVFCLKKKK